MSPPSAFSIPPSPWSRFTLACGRAPERLSSEEYGRRAVTEAELIARIEELKAEIKEVEGANPLLSHSGHLAISRKWLEELSDLKAQLAKREGKP